MLIHREFDLTGRLLAGRGASAVRRRLGEVAQRQAVLLADAIELGYEAAAEQHKTRMARLQQLTGTIAEAWQSSPTTAALRRLYVRSTVNYVLWRIAHDELV